MYVVMPCSGKTLSDIQEFVTNAPLIAKLKKEGAIIEVQNSVGVTGLATRMFGPLEDLGLTLRFTTFRGKVPYEKTILYDNSRGKLTHTLDYLKNNYTFVTSDVAFSSSTADIVIIVGQDAI